MSSTRHLPLIVAFVLVVAACGGQDEEAITTTTTVAASDDATETTAAPETTTTAEPESTTTAAVVSSGDADVLVAAKTEAAMAALPEDWTADITAGFQVESGSDDVYSTCSGDDDFDLTALESLTVAVSTLQAGAPRVSGSFFPAGSASIEGRVFESDAAAAEAFEVLETVFGTEDGRQCLADQFLAEALADAPPGEDVEFSVAEIDVPGSDVAVALSFTTAAEGFSFSLVIELAAARNGTCTVYGVFLGFGEPLDPGVRDEVFSAAASVV